MLVYACGVLFVLYSASFELEVTEGRALGGSLERGGVEGVLRTFERFYALVRSLLLTLKDRAMSSLVNRSSSSLCLNPPALLIVIVI
jgi:hypothetical protein